MGAGNSYIETVDLPNQDRSNYSRLPEYSPLPDTFSNVADEDTWLKMNKGYIADLDSLQMTPATKVQSFPLNDGTPVSCYYWSSWCNYYVIVMVIINSVLNNTSIISFSPLVSSSWAL